MIGCAFHASAQREIVLNTTGYGFDRTTVNGVHPEQWKYINKFINLKYKGKNASVTAVRLHIQWAQYEPTLGNYQRQKLALAIQSILDLDPNLKVALHFSYLRPGYWIDSYLANADIAQTSDGTYVRDAISDTSPSVYSELASGRFLSFVDDALTQLQPYASRILYAAMGNTGSEEFYIPIKNINSVNYSGMYEAKALQSWRSQFLPLRYPHQTSVTWGTQTYPIANSPQPTDGDYNAEMGRDLHRFAGWGLLNLFKRFYQTVKNRNSSLKVLYFISDFGSMQGNNWHLHSSTLPLALELSDGMYHTDGNDPGDAWKKVMGIDCIKGTFHGKVAAVEFDPIDLGKVGDVSGINENLAKEWLPRSFKHGAEYVHIAMTFTDLEITQLASAIAICREQFLTPAYQPPAREFPAKVNIFPNVFTGQFLFEKWKEIGGANFAATDAKPKSIKMVDAGYWTSIWDQSNYLPCNFSISITTSEEKPVSGKPITLKVNCSGPECGESSFSWTGEGTNNAIGNPITFNAPKTDGNYTYTVTSSRSGCGPKSAAKTLPVTAFLPVKLIRFEASKENGNSILRWATAEETNSELFEIEHSTDGKKWTRIGTIAAAGNVKELVTTYSFTDNNPTKGQNLYRLKMIDRDATFAYSRMTSLNFDLNTALLAYPNPVARMLTITTHEWENVKTVKILNNTGSVVYKSDNPQTEINVEKLLPGTYVLTLIRADGRQENVKFQKDE